MGNELGPCKINDRTLINPLELDFYWKDYNLAVEINGLYWHSELVTGTKLKDINKLKAANDANIKLLIFYEDEINNKPALVKSMILASVGKFENRLYARNTTIVEISSNESSKFLLENHIQGKCGGNIRLGLKDINNNLVAVMVIGKSRFSKHNDYEIIRFCQKQNTQILGAFSKLFKFAIKKLPKNTIISSYSDKRLFSGTSYIFNGFKLSHETGPGFWYTDYITRISRFKFQKHKINNNPLYKKIDKIWDCGQLVFKYTIS